MSESAYSSAIIAGKPPFLFLIRAASQVAGNPIKKHSPRCGQDIINRIDFALV